MEHCQMHAGHEARMDAQDENCKDILKNIRELAKGQGAIRERLALQELESDTIKQKMSDQEQHTRAITKMGMSVEYMADQVKEAIVILKEHDGRLAILERVPNTEIKDLLETTIERVGKLERGPGDLLVSWAKLAVGAMITGGVGIYIGTLF